MRVTVNRNGYTYTGTVVGYEKDEFTGLEEVYVERDDNGNVETEDPRDVTRIED